MKKMMLALACAAAFAVSAEEWGYVGFEGFDVGAFTYGNADSVGMRQNSKDDNFLYASSSGSEDGSSVVAYDGVPSLPAGSPKAVGENYLSLSTEGGTLWRSLNAPELNGSDTDIANGTWEFGAAVDASEKSIYIDTMVQFTPTEDGSEPDVGEDAKLALWLNVATDDAGNATTNLCVRGAQIDQDGVSTPTTFTIVNKADIVPGKWYRLTVEAIAAIDPDDEIGLGVSASGFIVMLDGEVLVADKCTFDDTVEISDDADYSDLVKKVVGNKVFANIKGDDDSTLTAVGFKGSGAIDEFLVTDAAPTFDAVITTVDFTLAWGEGVSAVKYTIEGASEQDAVNGQAIKVDAGKKVTVAATPADWYVIASGTGDVTVDGNQTVTVEATLAESPSALEISADPNIKTADLKAWADGKATIDQLKASAFVTESFLLNTASLLTAAPTLKIENVEVTDDGKMNIVVSATGDGQTVDMEKINGQLKIMSGDTLDALATATASIAGEDLVANDGKATVTVDSGKFAKVSVDVKEASAE